MRCPRPGREASSSCGVAAGGPGGRGAMWCWLRESRGERPPARADRRPRRRGGAGGVRGGRVGGPGRARRGARRRRGLPAGQDVRRRAHARVRFTSCSGSGSRTGCEPTRSTRDYGRTASVRRCSSPGRAALCRSGGVPWPGPSSTTTCARSRSRPEPPPSTEPVRSTSDVTASGSRRSCSSGTASWSRSAAGGSSSPTACAPRWASCSAVSGTARPSTESPAGATSSRRHADDPWISSHLELRGEDGEILSGYGWIFPLGDGRVNLGVGTLATAQEAGRPGDQDR